MDNQELIDLVEGLEPRDRDAILVLVRRLVTLAAEREAISRILSQGDGLSQDEAGTLDNADTGEWCTASTCAEPISLVPQGRRYRETRGRRVQLCEYVGANGVACETVAYKHGRCKTHAGM